MDQEINCVADHQKLVKFDLKKAQKMTATEVRKEFPRVTCQECQAVVYASFDHYMAGDW